MTWTAEEDDLLRSLASATNPNSWSAIAKALPTKTASQISGRWERVLNPRLVKGSWTREEDETIVRFVQDSGTKDWAKLARLLTGRTGKQCRERFKNHLDPWVVHDSWTPEADQMLIALHREFGNQWTRIATMMGRRGDNAIKNRWNTTLKKRIERMESGQPLTRKRGRKPKNQQKIIIPLTDGSSPCSPPTVTSQMIEFLSFPIDESSIMLLSRKIPEPLAFPTIAQNSLDFEALLSRKY
jgi:hypothetical protein